MTSDQLDALERLEKAATNEPWASPKAKKDGTCQVYATHDGPLRRCVPVANTMKPDGDFIAAIRNAFPAMLKALREKSELERIGAAAKQINSAEWEYILRKLDACTDRAWAICQSLKDVVYLIGDNNGTHG